MDLYRISQLLKLLTRALKKKDSRFPTHPFFGQQRDQFCMALGCWDPHGSALMEGRNGGLKVLF